MKKFWLGLYFFNWAVIAFYWFQGALPLWSQGLSGFLIAGGRLAGLVAAYMILLQFFLVGRLPWLERVFGLDRLTRLHHKNGRNGILLLLFHPVFIVWGYMAATGAGLRTQLASLAAEHDYVLWAMIGAGLFLAVVGTSIYVVRSRLRYEAWYGVHLIAYGAVFLSFWHQLAQGGTLLSSKIFYGYWVGLYAFVFASHFVFRVARPFYLFYRHRFVVERVVRESPDAVSVYIAGRELEKFPIKPGQFMILRFLSQDLRWQSHPFSLSKVPDGKTLRVTVKELGDYTKQVKNVPLGTRVFIDGPYGVFTDFLGLSSKVLLIAGGIGITPIRSLAEEMLKKGHDVVLLYGNKTEEDIVFRSELEELQRKYPARIVNILSNARGYEGETGHIDEEKIKRLVPDIVDRDIYLCGPVPMMDSLLGSFQKMGLAKERVHYERFAL
ncbi:MAG TPA: ferredoxin reductase family protein [Candidatus Paceibacterota bacterium]|nr:ferredoxin reductase family protein [Candidatus Paceibacterota bacterium]